MNSLAAAALALAAAVLAVPALPRRARRPLRRLDPAPRRSGADRTRLSAALAGVAVAVLADALWGVPVGVLVACLLDRLLRRLEPAAVRAERVQVAADLPLAADLLAAALRAGAPVDAAVGAVADALGGPLALRLLRVARALRLGAAADSAWGHLVDGSSHGHRAGRPDSGVARVAAAAVRSSASGAGLARALTRLADELRADRAVATDAASRRAGVLIVLPLGLCFLPAFVLAGLVPVVVAVLGDVL